MMNLLFSSEHYALIEYPTYSSINKEGKLKMTPYCFELVDKVNKRTFCIVGIPAVKLKARFLKYIEDESPTMEQMEDYIYDSMGGSTNPTVLH